MGKGWIFWAAWAGFVGYAFLLAPPDRPETLDLILNLSTGRLDGINPLIIALFNIMGIWPVIYSCVLLIDGRSQKIPAWLFSAASFGVGAFALLPYFGLRKPNHDFPGTKNWLIKLVDSRWNGWAVAIASLALVVYGFSQGNWADFVQQWQTSRFIHVMSLDFCALAALFPAILGDDMARRGLRDQRIFWAVALVPLLGPAFYLALRPNLRETPGKNGSGTSPEQA